MDRAMALAAAMQRAECGIKLGMEFFNANGPQGIREIRQTYDDLSLFIDLKYHDIPNTVAGAVSAIAVLAPDFINVHASGGYTMMKSAADALAEASDEVGVRRPQLLGVTILTSLDQDELHGVGFAGTPADNVERLATLSQKAGMSGVVCAAHEIETVRAACGSDFTLMVPGIRPVGSAKGDQKRVMTPEEAVHIGADHLVIGRPITGADDPVEAAMNIVKKLLSRRDG
jgi:orotidine-5'-phosphate decarboxylase